MEQSFFSIQVSVFEWKIEDALSADRVEGDEFVLGECRWRLNLVTLTPRIGVCLSKLNSGKLNQRYQIRSFIEDRDHKPTCIQDHALYNPNFTTEIIWDIGKSELLSLPDVYLTDGTLTFVIVFTPDYIRVKDAVREKVSDKSIHTSLNMDSVADQGHLSLDLRRLLDDGVQSDVTLKCGGSSFHAHKAILSARSVVFSAMFQSDMAESRTGGVQITDVDASALSQFLHYVYSGKLPDLSVDAGPKLYAAADKYSMEPLKKSCAKFMQENLKRENACRILVLADSHGDERLKDSVLRFITNVELLRNKGVWLELLNEHPKLAGEVLHHAYETKCLSTE